MKKTPHRPDVQNDRCMKDCKKGEITEVEVLKGVTPLGPFQRGGDRGEMKKEDKVDASPSAALYNNKCAVCHTNGIGGAPIVGDKGAWTNLVKQGKDTLYANAINGKNGMPPKGGDISLSDDDVKSVVDYMVNLSK